MQHTFYSWAIAVACVAVITSMFEMLLPSGNIKKFARVGLGLAMVLALISPLCALMKSVFG